MCYNFLAEFVKKPKKALERFKMIHPEYDEEIVSKATATINGRGGMSVRVRTCIAIAVSICIIFAMLIHFE